MTHFEALHILAQWRSFTDTPLEEAARIVLQSAESSDRDRHRARMVMQMIHGTSWESSGTLSAPLSASP